MNVEVSEETAKRIEAIFGVTDGEILARILDRVATDEQLLKSLFMDDPSEQDLQAIREGIADAETGRVRSIEEFDREFRARNGFVGREPS